MNTLLMRCAMIAGVSLLMGVASAKGLSGMAFGMTTVLLLTFGHTVVDVASTPEDVRTGAWYRRNITFNLAGTAIAGAILVAFIGLP